MKIGILGTGMVGSNIGKKLIELGYEVRMGSRRADNETASEWAKNNGPKASHGTFQDAAEFGDILFLCTKGEAALDVVKQIDAKFMSNKILADITNPLDFSKGMPPTLFISNTTSLGEEVQKALPLTRVVKTLNMVGNEIMINPLKSGGEPTMFVSGNDTEAKRQIKKILREFGWSDIIDLGDISGARGMEMLLPIWLQMWGALKNDAIAFKIIRHQSKVCKDL